MVRTSTAARQFLGVAQALSPRAGALLLLAAGFGAMAVLAPQEEYRLAGAVSALSLCTLALLLWSIAFVLGLRDALRNWRLGSLLQDDASPCFTTDTEGEIGYQNAAATARFGAGDGRSLVAALSDRFANPGSVLYRLQSRAERLGAAREDVVTRGGHTRLSVHRVAQGRFLWRLEEMLERSGPGRGAEALSLPMLVANKSGVLLFMNEAMRRLLGGRPKHLDRIFAGAPLHSGEETLVSTAEGPVRAIVAEVIGIGERREVYLLPVPQSLHGGTTRFEFENLPVAMMKLGHDGEITEANLAARELLGMPKGSDGRLSDLVEGLGRSVTDWIADVLAERIPGGAEVLRARHGEEDAFLQISLRRMVEGGRPAVLAVLNDATALKTLEAQFAQSQKMQAIGQLAGGIAHDFNNLLTAISGHCDLLLLHRDAEEPDYADLMQIRQNANRAASLVGQLLAFSRKQTLKPERIDLQEALSDLTHLLNRLVGERVRLELLHGAGVGAIRADRRQLEQVLINLVVNARDAMQEGGVIWIETQAVHLSEELRRDQAAVPPGDYAVIRVRDAGCGIPADRLQKIFEPFYTTKRPGEGTGLGLSTAYGIVKQTGGFIFVDSILGQGTTFQLYFPIHALPDDITAVDTPESPVPPMRQGGGVVLLVEDEAPVRAFASRALRMRGYTVLEAENAEEALRTLEDPALDVDLFVTDMVMPGLDGLTWVRKALVDRPDVKVVFVSGYAEDGFAEAQGRFPNSVFLQKPFSLSDLTNTVQMQLT